jgi:perosamine synthetase
MNTLLAIGEKHGIPIIEDAAEAIGSTYQDKRAGSMATFGVFSFHGSKTLTTGEGGMFATNDSSLYEHVLTLSNHGRSAAQRKQFWPDMIGYKFKMSNIQAAIGVAQMLRIEELMARKKEIFREYRDRLGAIPDITMNSELPGTNIGAWMPTVVFSSASKVTREDLVAAYSTENIDARVFFYPLSGLPMFGGRPSTRIAADIPQRAINLPSFHDMRSDEIQRVAAVVENLSHG